MKNHTRRYRATALSRGNALVSPAFVLAWAVFAAALLALILLASTAKAATPSTGARSVLLQQADPTQALPTAQTDVTNQQGASEEDQPLEGGSTDNNSNSGTTNNSTNSQQNPPDNEQQGSTQGGNAAGNTGGADSPQGGFPWWIPVILVLLIAVSVPFLRRRPMNEPATTNPAPDLERRDQR